MSLDEMMLSIFLKQLALIVREQNKNFPNVDKIDKMTITLINIANTILALKNEDLLDINKESIDILLTRANLISMGNSQ